MTFHTVSRLNAFIFAPLVLIFLVAPQLLIWLFGHEPSIDGEVLGRRAGLLFLIPTILLLGLSKMEFSLDVQKLVAKTMAIFMGTIAILGLAEFAFGRIGVAIFGPVLIEIVLFFLWMRIFKASEPKSV